MLNEESYFSRASDPERFRAAIEQFDRLNASDPNQEIVGGVAEPRELIYARRLTDWVLRLCPEPSEELKLAARSQHLCRWEIPRASYPQTRAGYHQWKNDLKRYHARRSSEVLRLIGYHEPVIDRVSDLNLKKNFPHDPETRVLEDALCLVFLQHQLGPLAAKLDDEKTINALRTSWKKMTNDARRHALALPYGDTERALIQQALA